MDGKTMYVAMTQVPLAALDDAGTSLRVFSSRELAETWIERVLAECDSPDSPCSAEEMNWNIWKKTVENNLTTGNLPV